MLSVCWDTGDTAALVWGERVHAPKELEQNGLEQLNQQFTHCYRSLTTRSCSRATEFTGLSS